MREITLMRVPGNGASRVSVSEGQTWYEFIAANDLGGRVLYADGSLVEETLYSQVITSQISDIFATAPTKGN